MEKYTRALSQEPLAAWNICDLGNAKSPSTDTLQCKYLSLDFGSARDPANTAKRDHLFDAIRLRKLAHMDRCAKLGKTRNKEAAQMARAMRAEGSLNSLSMAAIPTSLDVAPELLEYIQQPLMSTDFINLPWGDPRLEQGAVTAELEADVEAELEGEGPPQHTSEEDEQPHDQEGPRRLQRRNHRRHQR